MFIQTVEKRAIFLFKSIIIVKKICQASFNKAAFLFIFYSCYIVKI